LGDIRSCITREDMEKLRVGEMTGDELIVQARERREEHKVGGVMIRDYRLTRHRLTVWRP
jgi:hypothetical protein